ncbi:MAG: hypothetical protein ABIQ02_13155, partial [Saprospiraceae bacterium]
FDKLRDHQNFVNWSYFIDRTNTLRKSQGSHHFISKTLSDHHRFASILRPAGHFPRAMDSTLASFLASSSPRRSSLTAPLSDRWRFSMDVSATA